MEINTMSQIMRAIAQFIKSGTENTTLHTWFPEREVSLFAMMPLWLNLPAAFPPWRTDKPGGMSSATTGRPSGPALPARWT